MEDLKEKTLLKAQSTRLYGFTILKSPLMLLMIALVIFTGVMTVNDPDFSGVFILLLIGYFFLTGLNVFTYYKRELLITESRIIYQSLKPNVDPKEFLLSDIEYVEVVPSLFGKLFKFTEIELTVRDHPNIETLRGFQDGYTIKKLIDEQKLKNKH